MPPTFYCTLAVFLLKPKTDQASIYLSNVIVSISYLILSIEIIKVNGDRPSSSEVVLADRETNLIDTAPLDPHVLHITYRLISTVVGDNRMPRATFRFCCLDLDLKISNLITTAIDIYGRPGDRYYCMSGVRAWLRSRNRGILKDIPLAAAGNDKSMVIIGLGLEIEE